MPTTGETRFIHGAVVVRDDDADGRYARCFTDIHPPFTLDAIHRPSASVLFRLNVPINRASTPTTITLLITPDRIASLRTTICDTSAADYADDTATAGPPSLGLVRERLGGVRLVRQLRFQLHSGLHPQLVVPAGFALEDEPAESPARRVFAFITWLAAASMLSIYMPHNALPTAKLNTFNEAVRQFPSLTVAQRQAFERTVDVRRWYNGKGGTVVHINNLEDLPSTAARAKTDADAVAVHTPADYEDSPPQYDPPSKRHVATSPDDETRAVLSNISVSSDLDTSSSADVPGSWPVANNGPPPEYDTSQRQHALPRATKRLLHCGSEDVDLPRSLKRRDAKPESSRPEGTGLSTLEDRVQLLLQRQRHQIQELQEEVDALKRRNKQLEGRQDALEVSQDELQTSHNETDDKVESLLVHASELEDECEALKSQMPDVGLEMEDWLVAHMNDRVKDGIEEWLHENLSDTIQDYVEKQIAAHMAHVKARMRSALVD